MIAHTEISANDLLRKIKRRQIRLGGNRKLKIYGLLSCNSGKKMKRENRVFFITEEEALQNNYRPCGHCLKDQYQKWKHETI